MWSLIVCNASCQQWDGIVCKCWAWSLLFLCATLQPIKSAKTINRPQGSTSESVNNSTAVKDKRCRVSSRSRPQQRHRGGNIIHLVVIVNAIKTLECCWDTMIKMLLPTSSTQNKPGKWNITDVSYPFSIVQHISIGRPQQHKHTHTAHHNQSGLHCSKCYRETSYVWRSNKNIRGWTGFADIHHSFSTSHIHTNSHKTPTCLCWLASSNHISMLSEACTMATWWCNYLPSHTQWW